MLAMACETIGMDDKQSLLECLPNMLGYLVSVAFALWQQTKGSTARGMFRRHFQPKFPKSVFSVQAM